MFNNPYGMNAYGGFQNFYPTPQTFQPIQSFGQPMPQRPSAFPQQQINTYEKVNSFDEVKSYHMQGGTQMMFLDANSPYVYTKATDVSGRADIHAFELKEIPLEQIGNPKIDLSGYITVEEFEKSQQALINHIRGMESRILEQISGNVAKIPTAKESANDQQANSFPIVKAEEKAREFKREAPAKRTKSQEATIDEKPIDASHVEGQ